MAEDKAALSELVKGEDELACRVMFRGMVPAAAGAGAGANPVAHHTNNATKLDDSHMMGSFAWCFGND